MLRELTPHVLIVADQAPKTVTPETTVVGKSPITVSGVPLKNFSDEQFGAITLTTALTHSVNTVWAQVAEKLGKGVMADYMTKFGFDTDPPMDYPDGQMRPSGVFDVKRNKVISPDSGSVSHEHSTQVRPGVSGTIRCVIT